MISRSRSAPTVVAMFIECHDIGEQHRHLLVLRAGIAVLGLVSRSRGKNRCVLQRLGATRSARPAMAVTRTLRQSSPLLRRPLKIAR